MPFFKHNLKINVTNKEKVNSVLLIEPSSCFKRWFYNPVFTGSGVPGVERRRKKGVLPPTASPSMHSMLEHGDLGPTLTTPEPPADHILNKVRKQKYRIEKVRTS